MPLPKAKKKIPIFRLTRPYLNVLVKPRFFSGFLEKGEMPLKMHKLYFFPEENNY